MEKTFNMKNCTQCPNFKEDRKQCYCGAAMIILDRKEYYEDAIPLWCPMTR
jgi:hypothetical protein